MKQLAIVFLMIFVTAPFAHAEMVSIAGDPVNMRTGPGTRYPVIWELGRGYPLKRLERKGKWLRVKDFEGDTGWVYQRLTNKTPSVVVTRKIVNIRKGPGTKFTIVGKAEYGSVLKLITKRQGWSNITYSGKVTGWIKNTLLWGW